MHGEKPAGRGPIIISCYAAYLQGERERLERDLHQAAKELREKVELLGAEATSVPS
jgi:hypothetical protein